MAQEANSWDPSSILGRDTSFDVPESSCLLSGPGLQLDSRYSLLATWRRAVRCAAGSAYQDNVAPLVKQLQIVSLEHRWALQMAEIVFRCNHGSAPSALKDKLWRNNHGARTRGSKESYLPYRPSSLFGELSFFKPCSLDVEHSSACYATSLFTNILQKTLFGITNLKVTIFKHSWPCH